MSDYFGFLGNMFGVRTVAQYPTPSTSYQQLTNSLLYPNSYYTALSGSTYAYPGFMMQHMPHSTTRVYECAYCGNYWPQPFSNCGTCGGSMKLEPRYAR